MTTATPRTRRRRVRWSTGVRFLIAAVATIGFLAPIAWMVTTAFKTTKDAFSPTPQLLFSPTMDNFAFDRRRHGDRRPIRQRSNAVAQIRRSAWVGHVEG